MRMCWGIKKDTGREPLLIFPQKILECPAVNGQEPPVGDPRGLTFEWPLHFETCRVNALLQDGMLPPTDKELSAFEDQGRRC